MSTLGFSTPTIGDQNATADPLILSALTTIIAWANGNIGLTNTDTTLSNAFLKLSSLANRKLAFGSAAPGAWAAVAQRDDTFAHGLGATPVFAIATWLPGISSATSAGVVMPVITSIASLDATNIVVRSRTADGGTTSNASTVYWLAIA